MNIASDVAVWRASAAAIVLAALVLWESAQPYFLFFAGSGAYRKRVAHGAMNLALGLVNGIVIRVLFLALWLRTMTWSASHNVGLLNWLDAPPVLGFIVAILLLDGWTYAWHRINHTVPWLWRFHRLHHADEQMDVTTANRFHVVEIALSSLARVPVLALIGCTVDQLALYEIMLFAVVQFHHANVALPEWLDRALRLVIVTPHLHKVHHSVTVAEQNANFSSLFSWWDRIARTLRLSRDLSAIEFGVRP